PRPVLVVATAGVDQNRQVARADQPRVHARHKAVVLRAVVIRCSPIEMPLQNLAFEIRKIFFAGLTGDAELLLDPGDRDGAQGPGGHRVSAQWNGNSTVQKLRGQPPPRPGAPSACQYSRIPIMPAKRTSRNGCSPSWYNLIMLRSRIAVSSASVTV